MNPMVPDSRNSWTHLLNLNCREASRLIAERMERPLGRGERVALTIHLVLCKWCRRYRLQLRLIQRWVAEFCSSEAGLGDTRLSDDARRRLVQEIERL